ncbi:MAG TPA: response regulator [Aquabacterium sp.]|nr:response regulator [Aquabacterium sp.]
MLVVDDNLINRLVAQELLSTWGIEPLLAVDGGEAVALACDHCFDLILMDLHMPVLDGLAATRQIRRFEHDHGRARVPVVAFTSDTLDAEHPPLRDSGVDGVLGKPCEPSALHACVLRWCGQNGSAA